MLPSFLRGYGVDPAIETWPEFAAYKPKVKATCLDVKAVSLIVNVVFI